MTPSYIREGLDWNGAPYESVKKSTDDEGLPIILIKCASPRAASQCARALQNSDKISEIWTTGSYVEVS